MFSIQLLEETRMQTGGCCFWAASFLSYLKLTMTYLTRLLWSSSSYPTNCYDCVFTIGTDSLSFWRNFLLHVWQRLFRLLPCFFFWQVCWSFWRSVTGCGRLVLNNTLLKILPFSSGSTAIAFYILPQIPDKWLLSTTVEHQTFAGREADEIPEEWAGDVLFINIIYVFLQQQRQGLSTALLTMTSSMYVPLFLKCF